MGSDDQSNLDKFPLCTLHKERYIVRLKAKTMIYNLKFLIYKSF